MRFTAYTISLIEDELKSPLVAILQDQSFRNLALFYKHGYDISTEQAFTKIDTRLRSEYINELWSELIENLYDAHFLSKALNLKKRAKETEKKLSQENGEKPSP